jgi:hypothetical protein
MSGSSNTRKADLTEVTRQMQTMTDEQLLLAAIATGQRELQDHLQKLRPKQQKFLRFRAMADSDAQARHLYGKPRNPEDPNAGRPCKCGERKVGWIDLLEDTVLAWKKDPTFMLAYNTLLNAPVVFAATHLEMLAPAAVQTLAEIMGGDHGAEASQMRLAAVQVLQSTNLAQTPGSSGKPQSGTRQTMMERVRAERASRGIGLAGPIRGREVRADEISDDQRKQLTEQRGQDPSDYLPDD